MGATQLADGVQYAQVLARLFRQVLQRRHNPLGDRGRLVKRQLRPIAVRKTCVRRDRGYPERVRPERSLAERRPVNLQLGTRMCLKSLYDDQIDRLKNSEQVREARLKPLVFMKQRPARARGHKDLVRPSFSVAEAILAGAVHIEAMMRVFNGGHRQSTRPQQRQDCHDKGRFSATGPADDAKGAHRQGGGMARVDGWTEVACRSPAFR